MLFNRQEFGAVVRVIDENLVDPGLNFYFAMEACWVASHKFSAGSTRQRYYVDKMKKCKCGRSCWIPLKRKMGYIF